ncbi:MAG: hypothetical protein ACLRUB_03155 [Streptococcus sp.]
MSSSTSDSMNKIKYMTKEAYVSEMRMADSTDNSMAKTKKMMGNLYYQILGKLKRLQLALVCLV